MLCSQPRRCLKMDSIEEVVKHIFSSNTDEILPCDIGIKLNNFTVNELHLAYIKIRNKTSLVLDAYPQTSLCHQWQKILTTFYKSTEKLQIMPYFQMIGKRLHQYFYVQEINLREPFFLLGQSVFRKLKEKFMASFFWSAVMKSNSRKISGCIQQSFLATYFGRFKKKENA